MDLKSKFKYWYLGGPLPTRERISDTSEIFRVPNTFEPPLITRLIRLFIKNILLIIPIIISLIVIYLQFFSVSISEDKSAPEKNNEEDIMIIHNNSLDKSEVKQERLIMDSRLVHHNITTTRLTVC